jgi:signal peptidase
MVVIESSSMQHGSDSQLGVIDTGDLTLVKKVQDQSEIVTYVEATCKTSPHYGFKEYGDFGSVIVYRKNGRAETPVIHRAIAWIEYNVSASDPLRRYFRGDIPDIGVYNVSEYYVNVTSYRPENYLKQEVLVIQISAIFAATTTSSLPHSGFVTKGDHNIPYVDQWVLYLQGGVRVEPVKMEWVVGKAQGELPWFGLFKLWITGHDSKTFPPASVNGLIATVVMLIIIPILLDYLVVRWKKKRKSRREARGKNQENDVKKESIK